MMISNGPINVAFDSFIEKRTSGNLHSSKFNNILSPIDHASLHRLSDEAPLIILNNHLD